MSIRTIGDPVRNEPGFVDKFIGTDFDIVYAVYQQLNDIKTVAANLNQIETYSSQLAQLNSLISSFENSINDFKNLNYLVDNIYPDLQTGLNEVPINGYFIVIAPTTSPNDLGYIYLNQNGSGVLVKTIPSSAYNDALNDRLTAMENQLKILGLFDYNGVVALMASLPKEDTKDPNTLWNNDGIATQGSSVS